MTVVPDVGVAGAVVGAVVVVTGTGTVVGEGTVDEAETVGWPVAGRAVGPAVGVFVAVAATVVELLAGVAGFGVCVRVGVRFAVCDGDGVAALGVGIGESERVATVEGTPGPAGSVGVGVAPRAPTVVALVWNVA